MMTGWWILRREQTKRAWTWTDYIPAVEWLSAAYDDSPPPPGTDVGVTTKAEYAADALAAGVDVAWGHYTGRTTFAHIAVVCCPNRHWPAIPCPLGLEK
ncbi:hypothetical protein ABTZ59_04095 [Streptomyces sp. NPDC094034]|uniref:hypothetical protein n=1 Tax=Streptomyces sp. NPDC094034 TaxID=3155309 RepID=UPI003319144E